MKTTSTARRRWQQIIRDQQASGLSVAEYCRRARLSAWSLYSWRHRLRTEQQAPASFVEVQVARRKTGASTEGEETERIAAASSPIGAAGVLELHLPGRRCVVVRRGFDRSTLLELLHLLEASPVASSPDRASTALVASPDREAGPADRETAEAGV